eukprot:26612-Eustigmatos_ZCMA.PRE.1
MEFGVSSVDWVSVVRDVLDEGRCDTAVVKELLGDDAHLWQIPCRVVLEPQGVSGAYAVSEL